MSCGTKIQGRFNSWVEREDLVDKLKDEGEYRIADAVRRGDCLDANDLHKAERALERQGQSRYFDYKEEHCRCSTTEDEY